MLIESGVMVYEKKYLALLQRMAQNLKAYRKQKGLTQEQLAERVGFSARYYQRLESGRWSPNLLTLYKVSKQLKIDTAALFET